MKNLEAAGRQGYMTLRGYEPSLSFSISGYVHQSGTHWFQLSHTSTSASACEHTSEKAGDVGEIKVLAPPALLYGCPEV